MASTDRSQYILTSNNAPSIQDLHNIIYDIQKITTGGGITLPIAGDDVTNSEFGDMQTAVTSILANEQALQNQISDQQTSKLDVDGSIPSTGVQNFQAGIKSDTVTESTVDNGVLVSGAGIKTDIGNLQEIGIWKLGALQTGSVTPSLANYMEIEVNGSIYKLIIAS